MGLKPLLLKPGTTIPLCFLREYLSVKSVQSSIALFGLLIALMQIHPLYLPSALANCLPPLFPSPQLALPDIFLAEFHVTSQGFELPLKYKYWLTEGTFQASGTVLTNGQIR